ncbi:MAG: hypothetical protein ABIK65_04070 [Candidatus Eisenbacteria bacterium]
MRMAAVLFAVVALASAPAAPMAAADLDSLFREGTAAYREGRFRDAVLCFEGIRSSGVENGPLLYDLGTAYFKVDDLGRSMANLHRALRYMPRDPDLRANLEYVESRTLDRSMGDSRFPLLRLLDDAAGRLTWREWLLFAEIVYGLFVAALALRLLRPRIRKRLATPTQVLGTLLPLLLLLLARSYHDQEWVRRGAVVPGEIAARSGPGERFTEEFLLHPGTVVRMNRDAEGWVLVEVTPDLRGWVPRNSLEEF